MKICIVGGGINGLCCAWVLAQQGHIVHLYERDKLVSKTSKSSSKLLHGGLRYLEHGSFRLVKEALKERDSWLERAPSLTSHIRLVLPIYRSSKRNRWLIKIGLFIYDNLSRDSILPKSKWLNAEILKEKDPMLNADGLIGGYEFSDGQMDDYRLGLWVAEQAKQAGSKLYENTLVKAVDEDGNVHLKSHTLQYDQVINACGPWATKLLENSNISTPFQVDAVRGSHIVIDRECKQPYLFEVPNESRIFFVLPWQGNTLLGTTDIRQTLDESIKCSEHERDYLLAAYNQYYTNQIGKEDILESFAGIRPLLQSITEPERVTRDYAIHRSKKLINIFGGKWTTALALANKVSLKLTEK